MDEILETLVARSIQALERGDTAAVDELCDAHPELAPEIRRQLECLDNAGLLGAEALEIPERVGPYRVMEPLGRGGMGSVFLAEQEQPVQRQVALKVIRLGMDSREVLTRFDRERQALALMSHPHIATVFDAGLTDQGRPFIAMEYVPGIPITTYCEQHALSTGARLRLMAQVCDAVQHAHHKGVIHRDLKPSNVLVMEQDGVPMAKVIDFGVAKATHPDDNAATLHTGQDQILGTPEYMSPEQAGRGDVDARTDVYSLGVLLYELLTGVLPFEPARLRASADELLRIIRDEEPPTPSSRVTRGSRSSTRNDAKLSRRLRGELDWITLKALAKSRDRRYETPHDLAEDLRRYLRHEAVLAGPPSGWYRVQKFVRRYRVPVAAAGVVLLALVAGLIVSLSFYSQARASARRAETNFGDALAAVDQLLTRVGDDRLAQVPHMEHVRRALLEDALAFYRGFLAERRDDAALQFETARAHARVGRILRGLGRHAEAETAYGEAIDLLAALNPTPTHRLELARTRVDRAGLWRALDRAQAAEDDLRAALATVGELRERAPDDRIYLVGEATAQNRLGHVLGMERPDAARAALARATELARQVAAATDNPEDRRRAALYRGDLGNFLYVFGELQQSQDHLAAARSDLEALSERAPNDLNAQEAVARACQQLATLYFRLDSADPALLSNVDIALPIRERQVAQFPHLPRYRAAVAELLGLRARGQFERRQLSAAFETYADVVSRWEDLVEEYDDVADYRRQLATALSRFGRAGLGLRLFGSDRPTDGSEAALRRALALLEGLPAAPTRDADRRRLLSSTAGTLAQLLFETDRIDEAGTISREELVLARGLAREFPDLPGYQRELAGSLRMRGAILHERGDYDGAGRAFRDGIAALERGVAGGGSHRWRRFFGTLYEGLTQALLAAGRHDGAADAVRASAEVDPDDWINRQNAASHLMTCRELALASDLPLADRTRLAEDYAARAEAHALATEAVQADVHAQVPGMSKFHIARADTALRLARIQFTRGRTEAACASVQRGVAHADAAWRGRAATFTADRMRAFGAEAAELLRGHDQPDAAARVSAAVQAALANQSKR